MSPAKKQTTAFRAALAMLTALPLPRLRAQYEHAFGKPAGKTARDHLVRALAERGTAPAQATTSTPTKPASTVAPKSPTKPGTPPKPPRKPGATTRDPRLPAPGGTVTRAFKGKTYTLEVLEHGFRVGAKEFSSPTAAALALSGYGAVSGPAWWGYAKPRLAAPAKATRAAKPKAKGD